MSEDALIEEGNTNILWYEDDIAIRACELTLPQIKAVYRELATLTKAEGERILAGLSKLENESDEGFTQRVGHLRADAFRITVSIIGFDGQTAYGETEDIFDSKNLPFPIRTIFFTNVNSFKRNANGVEPPNRFSVWIHFDKPPLFDPSPLLSEPTPNYSKALLKADNLGYFRAAQNIISVKIRSHKKWYGFIHEKFVYDVGLWFIALPYSLYWITVYVDYFFPSNGLHASFRVAFYICGLGLCVIIYRALFGYIKWAFPVNTLDENKDRAAKHRIILGAIMLSLVVSGVKSILGNITGL